MACDELLFLPGTAHGESIQQHTVTDDGAPGDDGDAAAGVPRAELELLPSQPPKEVPLEPTALNRSRSRSRSMSADSSLSSIREFVDSWDDDAAAADPELGDSEELLENERLPLRSQPGTSSKSRLHQESGAPSTLSDHSMHAIHSTPQEQDRVDRFREQHPRITRIGSIFFFRSSSSTTQNAAYAPSGPAVFGAALDLSMPILFNFHLFIQAFNHYDKHGGPETPAKILPLIFLTVLIIRTTLPPGRRGRFWGTISCIFMAPFHKSKFRDSFLGDVLTSLVRPLQDIIFALAYYITVIYGTMTSKYGLSDSGRILESSHLLHKVILPSCSLLLLWWKFLQTLRESYDSGHRWPYLGNSFKYLTASVVVLYGMTQPEQRRSAGWIICFILALLYQIWWDTIMDWELFVITPRQDEQVVENLFPCCTLSSVRPDSYILMALHRKVMQPIGDLFWYVVSHIPDWRQIQLRPRRLYKSDSFYWRIFAYNIVFRAAWMLSFIPTYDWNGGHFSTDVHNYMGVVLPVVEILRRTLWGLLLLEVKTINMTDDNHAYTRVETIEASSESNDSVDNSKHGSRQPIYQYLPSWLGNPQQIQHDGNTGHSQGNPCLQIDDELRHKLFISELSLWAVAFVGFGLWATA